MGKEGQERVRGERVTANWMLNEPWCAFKGSQVGETLKEPCTRRPVNEPPSECTRGGSRSSDRAAVSVGTRRLNAELEPKERQQPGGQPMVRVWALTHPSKQSTWEDEFHRGYSPGHPTISAAQWGTRVDIQRHDSPECHKAPTAPWLRTQGLRNGRWPKDKVRSSLSTPTRPGSSVKSNLGCL